MPLLSTEWWLGFAAPPSLGKPTSVQLKSPVWMVALSLHYCAGVTFATMPVLLAAQTCQAAAGSCVYSLRVPNLLLPSPYICCVVVAAEAPVVSGTLPGLDLDSLYAQGRSSTSNGFALLQLQRGKVAVTPEELSYAPDWVIKAYQCLKLLLPASTSAVHPEQLDYVAYYYFAEGPVSVHLRGAFGVSP